MKRLFFFVVFLLVLASSVPAQLKSIVVYFNNPVLEANEKKKKSARPLPFNVYAVRRTADSTDLYRSSLQELLNGPTQEEVDLGYFTTLQNLRLTWFSLHDGEARVEFVGHLLLAGTLSGPRLRLQVEKTVKQFKVIKKVVIAINGRRDFDSLK